MTEWDAYVLPDFDFTRFGRGALVLDVGCGSGDQIVALGSASCRAFGLDVDAAVLRIARDRSHAVVRGRAEELPIRSRSLDGLVCKVSIPYCDEALALAEASRVLRGGGRGIFCYHGAGYFLRYLLSRHGLSWKLRAYALRSLVNTWFYSLTGCRLPRPVGDTSYQSRKRLRSYYRRFGLRLVEDVPAPDYFGRPVFLYQVVERID